MPNLTRVSRGSICLSSLHRRPSLFLSPFSAPSPVIPSSLRLLFLSLSPLKARCTFLSLPPARAPRAFIMHAKFHAEALRLASNPLITRCLRAPARASAYTGVHNARHIRAAACVHASPVARCAQLYLKAPERAPAAALLVFPLRTPASSILSLSPAAYLCFGPSLPLFNSFPPFLALSLSLAGWAARDNFRWPGSTLPRSRCVSLSRRVASRKNIPLVAGLDTCTHYDT